MEHITVMTDVNAPLDIVWDFWTAPEHIVNWNSASDDWHTTSAVNDLRVGGHFNSRMEAKNGSTGFDFEGVYDVVDKNKQIGYTLADGRKVRVRFSEKGNKTRIEETFDPENQNPVEMQRQGWQAILDRFKYYVEINQV